MRDEERTDAITTAFLDNQTTGSFSVGGGGGVIAYVYPFAGQPHRVVSTRISGTRLGMPVRYEHTAVSDPRFVVGAQPGTWIQMGVTHLEWRIVHTKTDSGDATCYVPENAVLVCEALNALGPEGIRYP